jgi:hypothetical protein
MIFQSALPLCSVLHVLFPTTVHGDFDLETVAVAAAGHDDDDGGGGDGGDHARGYVDDHCLGSMGVLSYVEMILDVVIQKNCRCWLTPPKSIRRQTDIGEVHGGPSC